MKNHLFKIFTLAELLIAVSLFTATGCYQLKLQMVDASVQKPSNVALYFSMDDKNGQPVPNVGAENFKIYEDGNLISTYESKQTMLNQEIAIERYTLLLLDMSGSVVDSGQVPLVQKAVGAFLENIGDNEKIAIYAFDGREDIIPISKFGAREAALSRKNELLSKYQPKDPSTNLNGAIIKAIDVLEKAKNKSKVPLRFGTLVIFTDGTDRAHRADPGEAMDAIEKDDTKSFVIGLGGEVDSAHMQAFGKDGFVHADDKEAIVDSFKKVADTINAQALRYYLFSYCSPSRARDHELTVVVEANEQKGRLKFQFNADGFKPKCDPNDAPKFDIPDPAGEQPETAGDKKNSRKKKSKNSDNKKAVKKHKSKKTASKQVSQPPPPPMP